MGSRIMHYAISQQVFPENIAFMIGNLAPDVSGKNRDFKSQTHFMSVNEDGVTRQIHPEWFLNEYRSRMKEPFVQGYYAHLLADQLWLKLVFQPVIRTLPAEKQAAALIRYYQDFHILNNLLIQNYDLHSPQQAIVSVDNTSLKEMGDGDINQVLLELQADFDDPAAGNLQILTLPMIENYIDQSITLIRQHLVSVN
ncbi:hypothetical protein [Furfurilactobacillus siliginis]|uniref:Hydrolase n=1 Tax=Furfurilactobacillus siliginis TaxID=348151 RepID=A0A0R2L5R2_9LACO|nr:hypothetical protein [Furfurilactobacillus siliginis]KRN97128.1 hypothetical protein IV55_GL000043 [Furfurilactobacillus siliginis]GEK29594.1 hypothetical protein LSI01_19050 [Furfurilactobacillus siliginis]